MVSFKKAKSWNGVQGVFLQREALCSTNRETSPTELLPRKPHPTSQHQVATALNPVWEHLCFTRARSFYASTSRVCPRVPAASLYAVLAYESLPRSALLSDSREAWTRHWRCCNLPHPPQSGHHAIFRHFVNYPAIHLYVHFPRLYNHDFT